MRIRVSIGVVLLYFQFMLGARAAPQGYIQDAVGNVKAQVGLAAAVEAGKNQGFENGTNIITGPKSHAVLKFEDGQVVMLKENTTFQVKEYAFNAGAPEKGISVLALIRGGLRVITGLVVSRKREAFRLETPVATMGIRGSDFAVETVNPLFGQVFAGSVAATNAAARWS